MTKDNDSVKSAFEAWWNEEPGIANDGPWIRNSPIQYAWAAWQAARERYVPEPCEWLQDEWDNSYDTSCGNKYQIIDGTPEDNDMKFCTYCGGHLVATPSGGNGD